VRALVTGADGFVGGWLVQHLESEGDEVWLGTRIRSHAGGRRRNMDVLDQASVEATLSWAAPTVIYHLAAIAFGPDVTADIGRAIDVTVRGTAFVLEAAAGMHPPPTVLIPSSSEVYGPAGEEALLETRSPSPSSLYGATKLAQETLGLTYHRGGVLPVVVARAFNHIGPGQRETFVVASLAAQLAEIASGRVEPILRVGNLDAERDFTDVRDVVRAYRALAAGGHTGEPINVASGQAVAIRSVVDQLIDLSGTDVIIEVDPSRLRVHDVPVVRGDSTHLRRLTGWQPRVSLDRTLRDIWGDAGRRHR